MEETNINKRCVSFSFEINFDTTVEKLSVPNIASCLIKISVPVISFEKRDFSMRLLEEKLCDNEVVYAVVADKIIEVQSFSKVAYFPFINNFVLAASAMLLSIFSTKVNVS